MSEVLISDLESRLPRQDDPRSRWRFQLSSCQLTYRVWIQKEAQTATYKSDRLQSPSKRPAQELLQLFLQDTIDAGFLAAGEPN